MCIFKFQGHRRANACAPLNPITCTFLIVFCFFVILCFQMFQVHAHPLLGRIQRRLSLGYKEQTPSAPSATLGRHLCPPMQANTSPPLHLSTSPVQEAARGERARRPPDCPPSAINCHRHPPKIAIACHMYFKSSSIIRPQLRPTAHLPSTICHRS